MKTRVLRGAVLAGVAFTLVACEAKKDTASAGMSNDMASAIFKDDAAAIKALLDKGESINAKQNGQTALHMAAKEGKLQVITTLLARGADVNAPDTNDYTPVMLAARSCKDTAIGNMLNQGAKVEAKDKLGVTALHLAADKGCLSTIKLLVERGANIQARTNSGITALAFAMNRLWQAPVVVRNDTDVVMFLKGKFGPGADTIKPTAEAYQMQQEAEKAAKTPAKGAGKGAGK
ncbi:MAG TPA: ankyrin repeat domain-containing protein [Fibrobacteria bacterium]|nr:ankyrin repeat domain-containing protein [Fibrobacteria bacterium]